MSAAEVAGHRQINDEPEQRSPQCWISFNADIGFIMVAKTLLLAVARSARIISRSNGFRISPYRGFATAAAVSEKLPLAGIRVLDMTRVLAGVCFTVALISRISQRIIVSDERVQPYCTQILGDLG